MKMFTHTVLRWVVALGNSVFQGGLGYEEIFSEAG
jgi:hypothetical protein